MEDIAIGTINGATLFFLGGFFIAINKAIIRKALDIIIPPNHHTCVCEAEEEEEDEDEDIEYID